MTLGDLISSILEWIGELWPIVIINDWERGFRVTLGHIGSDLEPGWHLFWPIIGSIETETITTDVDATDTQVATTRDGYQVMFSLAIKQRVTDPARMWMAIQDHESTIVTEVCAAAAEAVPQMLESELKSELAETVRATVKRRLTGWGVDLVSVAIFSLARVRTYRLVTGE